MNTLTLPYRPPLAWESLLAFLAARAAPAVECVHDDVYARTLRIGAHAGWLRASHPHARAEESSAFVTLEVSDMLAPVLDEVCARVRTLFDLDANPQAIAAHLCANGLEVREAERGIRVPGAADPFELAVRAILGQQVTVKGASTLMSRLTDAFGTRIDTGAPGLTHLAATARQVADTTPARIASLGMPLARATTIHTLADCVARGAIHIGPESDVPTLTRQLQALPGIGPWTAEYVIMRAVHWPDAFPESDLVLRRAAGNLSPSELRRSAQRWRPWRAYAAMHLWRRH